MNPTRLLRSLLQPRPASPALFPYTTLFRSLPGWAHQLHLLRRGGRPALQRGPRAVDGRGGRSAGRSEEHTSELQSRGHLVCRLLLEKKKNGEIEGALTVEGGSSAGNLGRVT